MAEGTNVGSVFLDLIVRDTVEKQVQAIAAKAQASAQQAFSGVEKTLSDMVEKAAEKAAQSTQTVADSANKAAESVSASAKKTVDRASEAMTESAKQASTGAAQAAQAAASNAEQAIFATMGKASDQISQVAQEASQKVDASLQDIAQQSGTAGGKIENAIGGSFDKATELARVRVHELETQLDRVTEKLDIQWNTGSFDPDSKATQSLLNQQQKLFDQIEAARERLTIHAQAAAQKQAAAEASAAQKTTTALEAEAAKQQAAVQQAHTAADPPAADPPAEAESISAWQRLTSLASGFRSAASSAFSVAGKAANGFRNVVSKVFSGAKTIVSKFGSAIGGLTKRFTSVGKSAGSFGTRLKGIVSSALIFNGLSAALRNVTSYLGTAVTSSNQMKDALANLKGAAATAAAPIIEMLTPALTALTNAAATAFSYLSRLISSFTGKSLTAMSNAAKSVQKNASAAKKAMASLAGFDEIERLGSNDSSGSGDEETEPNYDFQGKSSFLDSLTGAIKAGQWGQVGTLIAQKLNNSLAAIRWPDIQEKARTWTQNLVDTINGFAKNLDWGILGRNIGNGLNTILLVIDTFFQGINWVNLGSGLATGLNDLLDTIDWEALGRILTDGFKALFGLLHGFVSTFDFSGLGDDLAIATMAAINNVDWVQAAADLGAAAIGLLDTLTAWITGIDWQQIGNTIADAVAAVDWAGLVSSLVEGIGAACAGLAELIWGIVEDARNDVVAWWQEVAYEDGKFTIEGLLQGIVDVFANIYNWIVDNVCDPFMEGFRNAFGIHSPSTKMAEIGTYLIEGLFNGISDTWSDITTFFTDAFESLKATITEIWEDGILPAIKGPINSIIGCINGMISGICEGINTVIRALNGLKFDIPDWVPLLGGKSFGVNLKTITAPKIPMLANGGVITQPTLAMMGEYAGAGNNPEIVAPQSVIADTVASVMEDVIQSNLAGFEAVVAVLKDILEAVLGIEIGDEVIGQAVARYNRKMATVRGGG